MSKIFWYGYVYYADFVWNNDKIIEYKYYYLLNDSTIDSTRTRILQFTYTNGNIYHFLYKELLSGYIFEDDYYYYDSKINPYSESTIALVNGIILDYSCFNNWISCSSGPTRNIIYNTYNYPISVTTDWNNGNITHDNYSYNCSTGVDNTPYVDNHDVSLFPNPTINYFIIKPNFKQKLKEVKICDLQGNKIIEIHGSDYVDVSCLDPGLYFADCYFDNIIIKKKLIIYTR